MLGIVIPYYKPEFFEECLSSLSEQTCKEFKVYIGNDNSPHSPVPLVEKFSSTLDIIYEEFKENLGGVSLVKQWSRCIDMVKNEEWLMVLGDDDKLSPYCVEEFKQVLEKIEKLNLNVVRYATMKIDEHGKITSQLFTHPEKENSLTFLFKKMHGETRSSLSEYIFRKEVVDRIQFKELPLAWHADDLAILEFSGFGEILSINRAHVYFRNSGINISTLKNNLREKNRASFLFYYSLLEKHNHKLNTQQTRFLYWKLERAFLNDKKTLNFYLKYLKLRVTNSHYGGSLNFGKRYLRSIAKAKAVKDIFLSKKTNK